MGREPLIQLFLGQTPHEPVYDVMLGVADGCAWTIVGDIRTKKRASKIMRALAVKLSGADYYDRLKSVCVQAVRLAHEAAQEIAVEN